MLTIKTIIWLLALSTLIAMPISASADRGDRGGRPDARGDRPGGRGDRHENQRGWRGNDVRHFNDRDRGHWRGGNIRHFNDRDLGRWRSGRWHHGYHGDRSGWWWIVGGLWYLYPQRVADYPDPYTPPVVVVQQSAPVIVPAPTPAPASQSWYYCDSANGYHPYVSSCPEGWRAVPATPVDVPGR